MPTATFPKNIFVDFFTAKIEPVGDGATNRTIPLFEELLQEKFDLPADQALADIHGYPMRLSRLEKIGSQWCGEFLKHRIYDPAVKAARGGDPEGLNILDGETLISMACFLYDPGLNCLALERNRLAASTSSIANYLSNNRTDVAVDFSMLLQPDALARISQMNEVRYLTFHLASFRNLGNLDPDARSIGHGLKLAREFDAPSISVKIGMSHQRGSLNVKRVLAAVKDLLNLRKSAEEAVSSLKVCGAEDPEHDPNNVVDLIEDRLTYNEEVRLGHDPAHLYTVRRDLLRNAWKHRLSDIRRILGRTVTS